MVHPCMYKEHEAYRVNDYTHPGTPPHMRGIPLRPPLHTAPGGSPPVNSGNTWFLKRTKICQGSSPRMRGIPLRPLAHSDATEPPPRIAGNAPFTIQEEPTPPMRGTHHFRAVGAAIVRHTPAYAESTHSSGSTRRLARDHPRICGEHEQYLIACSTVPGSSPRMRGARPFMPPSNQRSGITPAYARNTTPVTRRRAPKKGQPRICGEHFPHCSKVGGIFRITPAYAGSTQDALA